VVQNLRWWEWVGRHRQHEQVKLIFDYVKLTHSRHRSYFKNSAFCLQNSHLYFCDSHEPQNTQRLFPYTALTDWLFS
jgi:hypothetical protein